MFRVVVPCLFVGAVLYCIFLHPVFLLTSSVSLDTRQACFPRKVHLNILLLVGSDGAPRIAAVSLLDETKWWDYQEQDRIIEGNTQAYNKEKASIK